ncbi:MAG: hypothetical protein ACNS63_03035 [Candidatus Nitrospinota bacterium M3_3B_026]
MRIELSINNGGTEDRPPHMAGRIEAMSKERKRAEAKAIKDEAGFYLSLFSGAAGLAAVYVIMLALSLAV